MSVEADIHTVLDALCPGKVFPDVAPGSVFQTSAFPFVVYQQVGGVPVQFLENGIPSKKNGRFQIATWSNTREGSRALARQIEAAMYTATQFQARPEGDFVTVYAEDVLLYGTQQDFSVWSDR